jgi:hypothetical protein
MSRVTEHRPILKPRDRNEVNVTREYRSVKLRKTELIHARPLITPCEFSAPSLFVAQSPSVLQTCRLMNEPLAK